MLGQDARDVERDVAGADHGDLSRASSGHVRGTSGWPSYQDTKSAAPYEPVEVDARDRQRRVADRAGREDHRVVELAQVVELEVRAVVHVGEQADVAALEHLVQRDDDLLDPRVVGRDAVADQAERRGQALEQVDAHVEIGLGQDVRGVDAGGTCSDDGDAQGRGAHGRTFRFGDMALPSAPRSETGRLAAEVRGGQGVLAVILGPPDVRILPPHQHADTHRAAPGSARLSGRTCPSGRSSSPCGRRPRPRGCARSRTRSCAIVGATRYAIASAAPDTVPARRTSGTASSAARNAAVEVFPAQKISTYAWICVEPGGWPGRIVKPAIVPSATSRSTRRFTAEADSPTCCPSLPYEARPSARSSSMMRSSIASTRRE